MAATCPKTVTVADSMSVLLSRDVLTRWIVLVHLVTLWSIVAAQSNNATTLFCPCLEQKSLRFSFLTRTPERSSTTGDQLRAGVRQAARDREVQLQEYRFVGNFNVTDANAFLLAEKRAGTAGIVLSLDSDQLLPALVEAHTAGIPIYLIGGGDPDLVWALQKRDLFTGRPMRASQCYIGPDEAALATSVAKRVFAEGGQHLDCITLDVYDAIWISRCRLLGEMFHERGLTAEVHTILVDILSYVNNLVQDHAGRRIVLALRDAGSYRRVKSALAGLADHEGIIVVVYDTSVELLEDVRAKRPVVAADMGVYTQGYLALALAFAERHTGQMVTSDVTTGVTIYSRSGQEVTNQTMQREVCRAAGNPVCGDPGVLSVTPTGCACFDRSEVRYKVIGSVPKRLLTSYHLYQGLRDIERFMPGSVFHWNVFDDLDDRAQIPEYAEVIANGSTYYGAISLDVYTSDINPALASAMRSVVAAGKPLYLGYMQTPSANIQDLLDVYKAKAFFGVDPHNAGQQLGVSAHQLERKHVLANNNLGYITPTWDLMNGIVTGFLGESLVFPPGTWEFPPWDHFDAAKRTGPWALFTNPETNQTAQVMDGVDPLLGEAFMDPLYARLAGELGRQPPSDTLVIIAFNNFIVPATLSVLKKLAANQTGRPEIAVLVYMCTSTEFSALLRQGLVPGEQLVLGCVDDQAYLSTYLAATAAALEQQTGERVVGKVRTERLLRYDHLPLNFSRRVACERSNYDKGFNKGQMGVFYPVCDVRNGCVEPTILPTRFANTDAVACSGRGTCEFPKSALANGTAVDGSKGFCRCSAGWVGDYCTQYDGVTDGKYYRHTRMLLGVLLSIGLALLAVGILLLVRAAKQLSAATWERVEARAMQEMLRKREPPSAGSVVTAAVMDVDGLAALSAWDAATTKKALGTYHAVIRMLLPHYHGEEVSSEDGGFTFLFHDSVDALGFAANLQQNLLHPLLILERESAGPLAMLRSRRSMGEAPSDWPPALLKHPMGAEVRCPHTGTLLYRGLRVRIGMDVGTLASFTPRPVGPGARYKGEVVDHAAAICGLLSGGQVLMSMQVWRSLGVHVASIVCHHMGMHMVSPRMGAIHLMQVLPEELAKRAPFPPLKSVRQLVPSFFDAPAAECYVAGKHPTEPVVIAFMYVASAKILRKTPGYQGGVDLLVAFVQRRLSEFEAYEVEEKDGNFLLAFRSAAKAVQFAEMVQREAMELPWSEQLLEEELAAEVLQPLSPRPDGYQRSDLVVFRGLRLQIGMCMDVPSDCQPHMTTGRAAYFGPVVNRAARIAATAAPGQTLVNHSCFEAAKDHPGPVVFSELGRFDLKGVMEPVHIYQVSSPALSARLFPRTLKLAKMARTSSAYKNTLVESDSESDVSGPSQRELPLHLTQVVSPNAHNTRTSLVARIAMGFGLNLGSLAPTDPTTPSTATTTTTTTTTEPPVYLPSSAWPRNRRLSLSMLLPKGGGQRESPKSRLAPPASPTNMHAGAPASTALQGNHAKAARRGSDDAEGSQSGLDDIKYDDMSYDELLKLAVRQHKDIMARKRSMAVHPLG